MLIPYPIKAIHAMIGFIVVSFLLMFYPPLAFIGHSAHIGGALVGMITWWLWKKFSVSQRNHLGGIYSMHDVHFRERVSELVRKMGLYGVESLTEEEKNFLREIGFPHDDKL